MASFSFALSPNARFGDHSSNMMARGFLDGFDRTLTSANQLADWQMRNALDPYYASAAGAELQRQNYASILGAEQNAEMTRDLLAGFNRTSSPAFEQPSAVTSGGDSMGAIQTGNPARLNSLLTDVAKNSITDGSPSYGSIAAGMQQGQQSMFTGPFFGTSRDWLLRGF